MVRQDSLTTHGASRYLDGMALDDSSAELDRALQSAIAADPLSALVAITDVRTLVGTREREAVFGALETHTWREVGAALGVSKQAAFQRFGKEWAVSTRARLPKQEWRDTVKRRLSG